MNKIAVLGSSGQIGAYLVEYLRNKGLDVDGYDIEPHPGVTNFELDLRDRSPNLSHYDFVYFLAFDVGGSTYLKTYQETPEFISNNMKIMSNVFESLHESKLPFIFTSSQMANMSYSPYGLLKHIGEKYTRALNGLTVKFWNVYGIERDLEKAHVITDFILKAKSSGTIDMMTDGTESRQFLYAEDCCECLHLLSTKYNDIDRDEELHITNFQWHTILEVAEIIQSRFPGCQVKPCKKKDSVQQDARNEPNRYILDHWLPKTGLPAGLDLIIQDMNNE